MFSAMPSAFLTVMVIGLVGLFVLATPALTRGHAISTGTHGVHAAHSLHHHGQGGHQPAPRGSREVVPADASPRAALRFVPSPRAIFSVLALYGAFGNVFVASHMPPVAAAFVAWLPAMLIERLAVRPLWNLMYRFQGVPSAPLAALIMTEATAVTPFKNGRGVVSVVRDGRLVQMSARLCDEEGAVPVRIGERLRVEDVDAQHERLTVSALHREEAPS
jgi:hypothetical protein